MKRLFLILSILLISSTGFTQDKSFYKTWNVSPENLIAHWNQSDPRAEATPQDLLDTTGNAVHLEQTTVTNQSAVTGAVNLSGLVDDYDGVDNFRVQEEIANGSDLTFLPDAAFYNLLDGEARSQLPAGLLETYPHTLGADLVADGDMEAALAVFDATDNTVDASEAQSEVQAHSPTHSSLITRTSVGNGDFRKQYRDEDESSIPDKQLTRLHIWLYLPSGQTLAAIRVSFDNGPTDIELQRVTATDTWIEIGPFYVIPINQFRFIIKGQAADQGDIFYIDDLSIKPVTPNFNFDTAPHVVVITDSTDAVICYGYPRVADSALAFGGELALTSNCTDPLDDQNNTNGWVPRSGTTLSSEAGGVTGFKLKVLSDGATLRFASFTKTVVAGTLFNIKAELGAETGGDIYRLQIADGSGILYDSGDVAGQGAGVWDTYDVYVVAIATDLTVRVQAVGGGDIAYADNVSLKEVTNLGETAALIWNTPSGGGTQSWLRGDGNPNDPATLVVRKSGLNFTGDMSAFVLVKLDDGQSVNPQALIAKLGTTDDFISWMFSIQTDGKVQFVSSDNGTDTDTEKTDNVIFANGPGPWTLLGFTKLGSTVVLYVNGVAVPSTTTGAITDPIFDSPEPVMIGASNIVTPDRFLGGEIADLPIWGRALSAAEVQNYWLSRGMRKLLGGL